MKRFIVTLVILIIFLSGCGSKHLEKVNNELDSKVNELLKTIDNKDNELTILNDSIVVLNNKIDNLNKEIERYKSDINKERDIQLENNKKIDELNANIVEYSRILDSMKDTQYLPIDNPDRWIYIKNAVLHYYPDDLLTSNRDYYYTVGKVHVRLKDSDGQIWCFIQTKLSPYKYGWVKEKYITDTPSSNVKYTSQSIAGIHIGDTYDTVISILGEPIQIDMNGNDTNVSYRLQYEGLKIEVTASDDIVAAITSNSALYTNELGIKVGDNALTAYKLINENYKQLYYWQTMDKPSIFRYDLGNSNCFFIDWDDRSVEPDEDDVVKQISLYNGIVVP